MNHRVSSRYTPEESRRRRRRANIERRVGEERREEGAEIGPSRFCLAAVRYIQEGESLRGEGGGLMRARSKFQVKWKFMSNVRREPNKSSVF